MEWALRWLALAAFTAHSALGCCWLHGHCQPCEQGHEIQRLDSAEEARGINPQGLGGCCSRPCGDNPKTWGTTPAGVVNDATYLPPLQCCAEQDVAVNVSPEHAHRAEDSQHNHDHDFACGLAAVMLSGSWWGVLGSVLCILAVTIARVRPLAAFQQRFYPRQNLSSLHHNNRAVLQVWLI